MGLLRDKSTQMTTLNPIPSSAMFISRESLRHPPNRCYVRRTSNHTMDVATHESISTKCWEPFCHLLPEPCTNPLRSWSQTCPLSLSKKQTRRQNTLPSRRPAILKRPQKERNATRKQAVLVLGLVSTHHHGRQEDAVHHPVRDTPENRLRDERPPPIAFADWYRL